MLPDWSHPASDIATLIIFLCCVAFATIAQTLTGFAFGLMLLGSVALLDVVPVPDAANAAMVLTLVNAYTFFKTTKVALPWKMMSPALISSQIFVGAGFALLHGLTGSAEQGLKILLGVVIGVCAVGLLLQTKTRETLSSRSAFGVAGAFSGLLGGLFGTSGPPIVYLMYKQPLRFPEVRAALILMFTCNALLRFVMVLATGSFSARSVVLSCCSVPVVHVMTRWTAQHSHRVSPRSVKIGVSALLLLSGFSLMSGLG